jgi:hypothetical protein
MYNVNMTYEAYWKRREVMKTRIAGLIGLIAMLISACIPVGTPVVPTPTETSTAPIASIALVQSIEVQILESDPVQVNAIVRGQLPDAGCTTIASADQVRAGNTFKIMLMTTTDPLALCAQALTPFEEVVLLNVRDLPPGEYVVNVNGVEQSFELPAQNASNFEQVLVEALNARNYDLLKTLMGDPFIIGYWLSEGTSNTPEQAVELLKMNLLNSSVPIVADPNKDLAALLGTDPVTIMGPDVIEASALLTSGWGSEGKDQAILFIAKKPDGGLYWHGLLFAKDGFEQSVPTQPAVPTANPPTIPSALVTPTNQPTPVSEVIPTISIVSVVQDNKVTIQTHNYPANTDFDVRMGDIGTQGVNGVLVGTINSTKGGSFTATFDIPKQLYGEDKIAIRLESRVGYYSYNWFYNE